MKMMYVVFLERSLVNGAWRFTKLLCPDLQIDFYNQFLDSDINENPRLYLETEILAYLEELQGKKIVIPKPTNFDFLKNHLSVVSKNKNIISVMIEVDFNKTRGCFERTFPVVGMTSRVVSLLSYGVHSIVGMTLTSGNSRSGIVSGIFGAVSNLFISIIIYQYSRSSDSLADIGQYLDNCIYRKKYKDDSVEGDYLFVKKQPKNKCLSLSFKTISIASAAGIVLTDTICTSLLYYQFSTSLTGKAEQENQLLFSHSLMEINAYLLAITIFIANFAFEFDFAKSAARDMNDWLYNRYGNTFNDEEEDEVVLGAESEKSDELIIDKSPDDSKLRTNQNNSNNFFNREARYKLLRDDEKNEAKNENENGRLMQCVIC
jgi:hypothetical protein